MKTIDIDRAVKPLSAYAHGLGKGTLVVVEHKKPILALVSLDGVDKEELALSCSPRFMEIINRSRRQCNRGNTVSMDEMRREFLGRT